jgi:hypothetical protein
MVTPTEANAHIMGVARQASTSATGRLVGELKAEGADESKHEFHKGLAVIKQLHVGRFVSKIDSDGAVFTGPFGGLPHVSPPGYQVLSADETRWGSHVVIARPLCRAQGVTTQAGGMWPFPPIARPPCRPTLHRWVPPLSRTSAREAVRQAAHGARRKEPL